MFENDEQISFWNVKEKDVVKHFKTPLSAATFPKLRCFSFLKVTETSQGFDVSATTTPAHR